MNDFYRTMLCIVRTTASQAVRPSVSHTLVFCQNGQTYLQTLFTIV